MAQALLQAKNSRQTWISIHKKWPLFLCFITVKELFTSADIDRAGMFNKTYHKTSQAFIVKLWSDLSWWANYLLVITVNCCIKSISHWVCAVVLSISRRKYLWHLVCSLRALTASMFWYSLEQHSFSSKIAWLSYHLCMFWKLDKRFALVLFLYEDMNE